MKTLKNLALPIIILTLAVSIGIYFRPLMVIDETRYIGVAWEMWDKGNFLVPHLNGTPYDHKFPLLFWLIHLDWWLFGVNETSVRLIPLLFAIGSVVLTYKIYLELFKDEFGAKIVGYIVAGTVLLQFYASLLMFDVMLSFFVLLGVYAILLIANEKKFGITLFILAICFGILAKGPVVGAFVFPLFLFAFYWTKGEVTKKFYIKVIFAGVVGILLSLIWIVPAIMSAGDAYGKGLLLKQSIGRIKNSFAHARPIWWYLRLIPVFMFPWLLYSGFYKSLKNNFRNIFSEKGLRFIFVWIVGILVIFSLISGKRVGYILPIVYALSIFIARFISLNNIKFHNSKILGTITILLSISILSLIFIVKGYFEQYVDLVSIILSSTMLFLLGLYLLTHRDNDNFFTIKIIAINSILIIFSFHYLLSKYFESQNLTNFSQTVSKLQNSGYTIFIDSHKYADQFHFMGRLHKPILLNFKKQNDEYKKQNIKVAIITYIKRKIKFDKSLIITSTKYRTENAILLYGRNWFKWINTIHR